MGQSAPRSDFAHLLNRDPLSSTATVVKSEVRIRSVMEREHWRNLTLEALPDEPLDGALDSSLDEAAAERVAVGLDHVGERR